MPLANGGRATEPFGATKGLLPTPEMSPQLVLDQLWAVLLVMFKSLEQVPGALGFSGKVLVCAALVVFIVRRGISGRRGEEPATRGSACGKVDPKARAKTGPKPKAHAGPPSPVVEDSPLWLQNLCLAALNGTSTYSLQNMVDLLKEGEKSQPPELPQVLDTQHVSVTSQHDGDLQRRTVASLDDNRDLQQVLPRQKQQWHDKEKKRSLESAKAVMNRAESGQVRRRSSLAHTLLSPLQLPSPRSGLPEDGDVEVEGNRGAGQADRSASLPQVPLKSFSDDGDLTACLGSPEEETGEVAGQLCKETRRREELEEQIETLQAQEASLQEDNARLDREIQELELRLQTLPALEQQHVTEPERKLREEEVHCSEMEKRLATVSETVNRTRQTRDIYKKMAEDLAQELETSTSFYQRDILFHERGVQDSRLAAVSTERDVKLLRRENNYNRQKLAALQATFQPFPSGPLAARAPWAAHGPGSAMGAVGLQLRRQRGGSLL
ncbi:PREDICTED: cTAGE family member 5-like [Propithecus coquereli]|uniref:cTAGE family member 5-like n=1 Tax=Propithecus coquereli TaxID=379532 RepID=UPI00063F53E3|nr:PREDICTED: cTAGE family member 5-like [Propithecus coquereli]